MSWIPRIDEQSVQVGPKYRLYLNIIYDSIGQRFLLETFNSSSISNWIKLRRSITLSAFDMQRIVSLLWKQCNNSHSDFRFSSAMNCVINLDHWNYFMSGGVTFPKNFLLRTFHTFRFKSSLKIDYEASKTEEWKFSHQMLMICIEGSLIHKIYTIPKGISVWYK